MEESLGMRGGGTPDGGRYMLIRCLCSLNAPTEVVKQIIINIEAGVEVEVTIAA